jgi:hypothetical protein
MRPPPRPAASVLGPARGGNDAEDVVDLAGRHVPARLVRGHDQVGSQLDLVEQLGVLEAHVERIQDPGPFPLFPSCEAVLMFYPAGGRQKPPVWAPS